MEWKSQLNDYIIMVSVYSSFISPPERCADHGVPKASASADVLQVLIVLRMYVLPLGCVPIVYRIHVPTESCADYSMLPQSIPNAAIHGNYRYSCYLCILVTLKNYSRGKSCVCQQKILG